MNTDYYPNNFQDAPPPVPPVDTLPGMPAPPVMPDVTPFPKKRGVGRGLLIAGGVIALLAVVAVVVALATGVTQKAGALVAANNFCNAEKQQNYTQAYSYFSPALRSQVPQDAFTAISQGADTQQGKVTACSASGVTVSQDGKSAVVHGSMTRQHVAAQKVDLQFILTGGNWKISQAPDATIYPLTTAFEFCKDIKLQQFDAAYQLFTTSSQQMLGSADNLKQQYSTVAQAAGTLSNCNAQSITIKSTSATIQSGLDFSNIQNLPAKIFLQTDTTGAWKISVMEVSLLGNFVPVLPLGATPPSS
jgi:hypothetical protein